MSPGGAGPGTGSGTALLALHYQNDVLHPQGRIRVGVAEPALRERVCTQAAGLLALARARGWALVHVRIAFRPDYADLATHLPIFRQVAALGAVREGDWGAEFLPALAPRPGPREFVLTHQRISAFCGTALAPLLRQLGATRLVVAGVATHSVVEGTVREAADQGFDTTVVADACAAAQPAVHAAALASMALVAGVTDLATLAAAGGAGR